jgi:AmmeMemoRadiSam system protein B/AmmeMemoRadiSam system protein A
MKWSVAGFVLLALCSQGACRAENAAAVREPAVAGQFYPADPAELAKLVDGLLAKAPDPQLPEVVALVAPHAGYQYSAEVAAHAYAALKGRKITRVVVISPSHIDAFPYSAVFDGEAYATPLGRIPVDRAFAAALANSSKSIQLSDRGHRPSMGRAEHALEVQLPFLQRLLGQFRLVPIIMGDQSYEACRALGLALAASIRGADTVIVASSDLSHYHKYDEAVRLDRKTLRAIEEYDYLSLWRNLQQQVWEACGGGPIVAAMIAAEKLGARQARILKYANSGDVTGDKAQVVGYGAVAIYKGTTKGAWQEPGLKLGSAETAELFRVAHRAVETAVREHRLPEEPEPKLEALAQERGAFVTLKRNGELRGCIGYVSPIKPLALTVRDVAASAAVEDHRFPPVTPQELPSLEYEISVLSPMRRVLDLNEIQVGRDGLLIKQGRQEGVLLPQVPVEQGWDRKTFLEQACRKAGLLEDCYKDSRTDIFRFTALVLNEQRSAQAAQAQGTPRR